VIGATDDDGDVGFAWSGRRTSAARHGVDRSTMANSQALTWNILDLLHNLAQILILAIDNGNLKFAFSGPCNEI
jgi:hypothetical protein